MKTYNVKIELISEYLQMRFIEADKKALTVKAGKGTKMEEEAWKELCYVDKKGCYIPKEHIKGALVNGGKSVKRKPRGSFKDPVKAYVFVLPEKIYMNKKEPDFIQTSYPKRMDGSRVKLKLPGFNKGMKVAFNLEVMNEEIDIETLKMIIEKAGLEKGIGTRRPEYGRFQLVSIKEKTT